MYNVCSKNVGVFQVNFRNVVDEAMVRETRYLLVGNIPDSTTEDEVTDYFKR